MSIGKGEKKRTSTGAESNVTPQLQSLQVVSTLASCSHDRGFDSVPTNLLHLRFKARKEVVSTYFAIFKNFRVSH